jgi:hypothetical protein
LKSRKVGGLPPNLFRFWILCLVSAQEHDHRKGTLPSLDDLAYSLHMQTDQVQDLMAQLVTLNFVTDRDGVYEIHDWKDWKHDPDPTAAERKRRQRTRPDSTTTPAHVTRVPDVTAVRDATDVTKVTAARDVTAVTAVRDVTGVTQSHDVTGYQSRAEQSRPEPPLPPRGGGRVWNSASPPGDPEVERLAGLAAELSGDVGWSMWVSAQAKLGHPPPAIEQALDVCVNTGKWSRNLAAGVLRRLASEGYPEPRPPSGKTPASEFRSQAKAYKIIPGP